jgi:L-ascorbate metabolism protein UlaG (beta-lactamase superfamily)
MISALYIGGPTAIIEISGLRFMTDPTLDRAGNTYTSGTINLQKTQGPAAGIDIGKIDYVLLSHDQHPDNLDKGGRGILANVIHTYTTKPGAARLGGTSIGLAPWESKVLPAPNGDLVTITATPARHGPAGIEKISGEVIGFMLSVSGKENMAIYITGDTVYYEGVAEVAKAFKPKYIVLFAGAAKPRGPFNMTMGTNDALDTAFAFPQATIIPLHYEGWKHLTQDENDLLRAFEVIGIKDRLKILGRGIVEELS